MAESIDFHFNGKIRVESDYPGFKATERTCNGGTGFATVSFGSQGVENMDDFDPQTMIKNVKFVFTPSATLKAALSQATFEQEGIVEDGIKYGSKLSYQKAKGLVADDGSDDDSQQGSGGGQTQPGGSGEGGSGASGEE